MTNAFPQLRKDIPSRPYKVHEMESPNPLPAVQCNIAESLGRSTSVWTEEAMRRTYMQVRVSVSGAPQASAAERRAGLSVPHSPVRGVRTLAVHPTVITSPNTSKQGQSPSSEGWGSRPSRKAHQRRTRSASSNTLVPCPSLSLSLSLPRPDLSSGIALYRTDVTANYSNNFKINDNKNNMQSVKFSIVLDNMNNFEDKGIVNDICLISDISLILCVPNMIKINCYSSAVAKNQGAFPQRQGDEGESQRFEKTVDNTKTCDSNVIVNCILINQMSGRAPDASIPVSIDAINVQGMYARPHSHSFNPNFTFNRAEPPFDKSDYAFIDPTRIISNRSVFNESESVSRVNLARTEDGALVLRSNIIESGSNITARRLEPSPVTCDVLSETGETERNENNAQHIKNMEQSSVGRKTENQPAFTEFKNGELTFASLLRAMEETPAKIMQLVKGGAQVNAWGIPRFLGLAGGGESSLNTASGWGTPPNANNNNGNSSVNWGGGSGAGGGGGAGSNAQQQQLQWPNSNQRPPGPQPDSNSNKVGSGVGVSGNSGVNVGGNASGVGGGGGSGGWSGGGGSGAPTMQQPSPAQPNNSAQPLPTPQGGSGGGNNSPGGSNNAAPGAGVGAGANNAGGPPAAAAPTSTTAKAQLEQLNNMREALFSLDGWGGQHVNQDTNWDVPTTPEPGVKMDQQGGPPVWKPNVNNGTDLWEANLRNGGQPPPQPVAKTPWGHTPTSNIGGTWGEDDDAGDSGNVWTGPPPPQQQQWGGPPQQQQQQQQPPQWNAAKNDDWGGWGEPLRRDMHRPDMHTRDLRAPAPDHRDMRTMMAMDGRGDMRGDPRGISGRLNGTADMWNQHHAPHPMQPPAKMMPSNAGNNGANQWGAQGPKDPMGMAKGPSGWEEPSPPAARRHMPNFDDGTSLWGQQRGNAAQPWEDAGGMGRGSMQCPPGMPPNRMPGAAPAPMKPDAISWAHHGGPRNGAWKDGGGHPNWDKEGAGSWNEGSVNQTGGWAGPKLKPTGGSWDSDMGDWGGPKPPSGGPPGKISGGLLPKDMIWNSKQFRSLVDMGYKKDDVELALRSRDMNMEEAMDLLSQLRGGGGMDTWRRHEEHPAGGPPFDHQQQLYGAPPRPHHAGFPPQQPPSVPYSPVLTVQKILNAPTTQPPPSFNQQNNQSGGGGQPSTAQLRMLVQQIQMAVQAGYLNHQILNQPLAPQTLVLLNQLLQQIKQMQQLAVQNTLTANKNNPTAQLQISVQITKAKQQITNLQNQIAAQQAIYVKQQSGGGGGGGHSGGDFFNKPHDPLSQLQNNFGDITLNKDPSNSYGSGVGQQSRLNQWKLPSLDKEGEGSEFSRAPGTTSKPTTSPQLNPINLQPDNTWSSGRGMNDGWPSSDPSDLADGKESWPSSQVQQSSAYSDLVPEFEPGKPWKMKSIEDDPASTPGSVGRSSLSLATIKDTDIFGSGAQGKASPTTPSERSLSSSTWSYPPPSASMGAFNLPKGGNPSATKNSWGEATTGASEMWGSAGSKSRGPPPGLQASKSGQVSASSWGGGGPTQSQRPTSYGQQPAWQSTWLLLKNLTTQIDGSTLKTLCMQHGPLQSFHLYLTAGIALAKYSTREEANKAQTALSSCVLGNTTIFAESPAESDVNMILQHLGQGGNGGGGAWRGGGGKGSGGAGGPTSGDSWPFPSLWADPPLGDARNASASLSSFLPPDLLGDSI